MNSSQTRSKVYIEIVKQLRTMIETDGLQPGDKLPSERELSERLNVGRSSVREALRAIELLGLIETRRGEGTFIKDFRDNQLVPLLSTFVLQDERAKKDVAETKYLIELDCLRLLLYRRNEQQIQNLKNWVRNSEFIDSDFFLQIVQLADNHLFLRIWLILKDYYHSFHPDIHTVTSKEDYLNLLDVLLLQEEAKVEKYYRSLRKMSNT